MLFEHACPCVAIPSAAGLDRRFAAGHELYGGEMRLRKLSTRLRLPRRLLHEPPPPPPPPSAAVSVVRLPPVEPGTLRLVLHDASVLLDTFAATLQLWVGSGGSGDGDDGCGEGGGGGGGGGDGGGGGGGGRGRASADTRSMMEREELAAELASRRWQERLRS